MQLTTVKIGTDGEVSVSGPQFQIIAGLYALLTLVPAIMVISLYSVVIRHDYTLFARQTVCGVMASNLVDIFWWKLGGAAVSIGGFAQDVLRNKHSELALAKKDRRAWTISMFFKNIGAFCTVFTAEITDNWLFDVTHDWWGLMYIMADCYHLYMISKFHKGKFWFRYFVLVFSTMFIYCVGYGWTKFVMGMDLPARQATGVFLFEKRSSKFTGRTCFQNAKFLFSSGHS